MQEQSSRILRITTPLPDDRHAVSACVGVERINDLYSFKISIVTGSDPINPEELLGEEVTLTLAYAGVERPVFGLVAGFWQVESSGDNVFQYEMEVVPRLWILGLCTHNRIFSEKSTLDIVKSVIEDGCAMPYKDKTTGSYTPRETCLQYNETDLDFVRRLLADEGIAFYFEHTDSASTMVLVDSPVSVEECSPATYPYNERNQASYRAAVSQFHRGGRLGVGAIKSSDYHEWAPKSVNLKEEQSTAKASLKPGEMEVYGRQNFMSSGQKRSFPSGGSKTQVGRWLDSLEPDDDSYEGSSAFPTLVAGHTFTLEEDPKCSGGVKDFLLLEVVHQASEGLDSESSYSNQIRCAPKDSQSAFRPDFSPESPRIWGVQSATVVEEKTPNSSSSLAEIKVQFHWDSANESCWARVAQLYAGSKWGGYFVPRLGQEVLVEFINGDPDRPVVIGAVYNQDNPTPPYKKWQSGIRTSKGRTSAEENSSGKSDETYNELRFDDSSGKEEVYFQAQKDHNFLVKNNEKGEIGGDQEVLIKGDQKLDINGSQYINVGLKEKNGEIEIEAGKSITLTVGKTSIKIESTKITLDAVKDVIIKAGSIVDIDAQMDVLAKAGMNIELEGGMNADLKAGIKVTAEGGMQALLKGGMQADVEATMVKVTGNATTAVSGNAMLTLKGGLVMIN
ncbi:MAG: type VI secretion system secreted protein VgrG [Halieaceae bacterium]|jgi:type VI secretion system secreted protein VgrG